MTTLRYTPDKPYKLQIYAVNSEVEIFGMTDDLYYIRHGKNYGFLPKNHLREKARGDFPFSVEIDISSRRIDQRVREQNFLHEFLKSSQAVPESEGKVNETSSEEPQEAIPQPAVKEPSQENVEINLQDVPFDKPAEAMTVEPVESNEDNDSGIDEDEDDEDDEDDEEDSEEEPAVVEEPKKDVQEQPELVAIPPSKDLDGEKAEKVTEPSPPALPVPASSSEEIPTIQEPSNDAGNSTVQEPPKVDEKVPDFIPIKDEVAQEAENIIQHQNDTVNTPPEVKQDKEAAESVKKQEEHHHHLHHHHGDSQEHHDHHHHHEEPTKNPPEAPKIDESPPSTIETPSEVLNKTTEDDASFDNSTAPAESEQPQEPTAEKISEPSEPAPVTEQVSEHPLTNQQVDAPEIPVQLDVLPPSTEPPAVFEAPPPQIQIPMAPEVPETVEIPQIMPDEPELPIQEKPNLKPEPDALLKRFNEKLGNRIVEGTGKGSVEPVHKPEDHHHHHHEHEHDHQHSHEEKQPEADGKTPEAPIAEEEESKPGFFGGLFKKFFSDKDDSEQHFHDKEKVENTLSPQPETNGEPANTETVLILNS